MSSSPATPRPVSLDNRVLALLKEKIGHDIPERRHAQVKEMVEALALESGYTSVEEYLALARTLPMDAPLVQSLVHAITNKESYFFRDAPTVESLREHILPNVIERCRESKTLRIWSAGCSTGEELYTLSILLQEKIHDYDNWKICLLGTDIDETAVQRARKGLYKPWSLRTTPDTERRRYFHFEQGGTRFNLKNQFRKYVAFGLHNLADPAQEVPSPGYFDLIFCRNVLIYFGEASQKVVQRKFKSALVPGGLWIGGSSDPTPGSTWETRVFPGVLAHVPAPKKEHARHLTPFPAPTRTETAGVSRVHRINAESRPTPTNPTNGARLRDPFAREPSSRPRIGRTTPVHAMPPSPATPPPQRSWTVPAVTVPGPAGTSIVPSGILTPIEEKLDQASNLADRGALMEALGVLREVIQAAPLTSTAYLLLAQVQQSLGHPEAAVHELKRAIYLDPSNPSAQLRLGFLLAEQGGTTAAIRAFRAATALVSGLEDPEPELVEIRRTAASQLVRLLREESP